MANKGKKRPYAILIDWGYDRGLLYCPTCRKPYVSDVDVTLTLNSRGKRIAVKKLPRKVPVICRGCGTPRTVQRSKWIKASKRFDKNLLTKYVFG